jgi:hypothetical protein
MQVYHSTAEHIYLGLGRGRFWLYCFTWQPNQHTQSPNLIPLRHLQAIERSNMILSKLVTAIAALTATATAGVVRRGKNILVAMACISSQD